MSTRSLLAVVSAALTAAGLSCSNTSDNNDAGSGGNDSGITGNDAGLTDAGPGDGGGIDGGLGDGGLCVTGTACNSVTQIGDVITEQQVPAARPAALGGTAVPGTYKLTDVTVWTGNGGASGPTGHTRQTTLVASTAGNGLTVNIADVQGGCPVTQTLSLTFSGTEFTATATCPANCTDCGGTIGYTATSTTFTIFDTNMSQDQTQTFTMQ